VKEEYVPDNCFALTNHVHIQCHITPTKPTMKAFFLILPPAYAAAECPSPTSGYTCSAGTMGIFCIFQLMQILLKCCRWWLPPLLFFWRHSRGGVTPTSNLDTSRPPTRTRLLSHVPRRTPVAPRCLPRPRVRPHSQTKGLLTTPNRNTPFVDATYQRALIQHQTSFYHGQKMTI
jgi:hypothetical protein